jgi:uncharacterized membrane protein
MKRRLSWKKFSLLMAMSVVGLWASSMVLVVYNTLHHQLPACTLPTPGSGIQINCGKVLSSPYSTIFGVPLEVFAVAYFIVNLALIYLVGFGTEKIYRAAFRTLFVWRFLGICLVPYLVVVELFLVKAICLYCTTMHIAIIIDFGIISYFLYYKKDLRGYISIPAQVSKLP